MQILINRLTQLSQLEWTCELKLDEVIIESSLTLCGDEALPGFNISNAVVHDVLTLCGLDGEFSRHFFGFVEANASALPCYLGECDDDVISRVQRFHGLI